MRTGTPIDASPEQLAAVTYTADGLVPAVVQEAGTGEVLMMAWMTADTLRLTLEEGRTVFWSRRRQEVWRKGETSGEVQWVRSAFYDCDGDTLLFVVDQDGAGGSRRPRWSCGTGASRWTARCRRRCRSTRASWPPSRPFSTSTDRPASPTCRPTRAASWASSATTSSARSSASPASRATTCTC